MHRSVRFVLQPYKSRNPPLAAVTQARRDANSGSYGYKAVVTKQPLNRGCPMPDIAHAPDQIGLLHENYPHVLAATFRFNAFFAHQASILYYIFSHFAIAQITIFYIFTVPYLYTLNKLSSTIAEKRSKSRLCFSFEEDFELNDLFKMQKMHRFEQIRIHIARCYSLSISFSDSSSAFAASSLPSDLQKSSRSHAGSSILISASEAIKAPKKTLIF